MSSDTDDRNTLGDVLSKPPLTRDKPQPTGLEDWWSIDSIVRVSVWHELHAIRHLTRIT